MKKLIAAAVLLLSFTTATRSPYAAVFGQDYQSATDFMLQHGTEFEMVADRFGNDPRFLKSIVFPELIRYSQFSDLFETGTLEWLYVEGGSKLADFSIGYFQMKPSFAEEIEGYVSSEESLRGKYGFLVLNGSGSPIRRQRLERLMQQSWQLIYLSCFVDVMRHKFSNEVFPSQKEKLRFFASAYNLGIKHNAEEIQKNSSAHIFPYGSKYGDNQHCYAEIAVDYFGQLDN